MNITFYKKLRNFASSIVLPRLQSLFTVYKSNASVFLVLVGYVFYKMSSYAVAQPIPVISEPVQACVIARDDDLTDAIRRQYADCLGWQAEQNTPVCLGSYQPITVTPLADKEQVRIMADKVSFYQNKRSTLAGHVEVQQTQRVINAQTAYVYRDPKTNQITHIEFLGDVRYLEPGRMMIARKATINPNDKSGEISDVLYRFNSERAGAVLPAWGRASTIKRFANKDYLLQQATYTTCSPQDKSWDVEASSIKINNAQAVGVARNATVRIRRIPIFYTPYLSFPTNKERKSGFLLPVIGYSNVGGWDLGLPYYWNMAPNYDMTFMPHFYSERGVMLGDEFRFLTPKSAGFIRGTFLPHDNAYKNFLLNNELAYPQLYGKSADRWSIALNESTKILPNLIFHTYAEKVSDDYYLQDFSSNLAQITQRQLLREADLTYRTPHWIVRSMVQSYQTLHPVNEPPISEVYEQLPQIMARGFYGDLPFHANLNIIGQYDQFHWPTNYLYPSARQQGPRFHANPVLSVPLIRPWGFLTPSIELVGTHYQVANITTTGDTEYNRGLMRYSLNTGLLFERTTEFYTQTLEPRLFYLKVPYQNQAQFPIYDSGNMIFNMDQLFRTNRFSGFDRIGDANQLSYALTSRWLRDETGAEKARIAVGQIKYFADRKVQLCQRLVGECNANPLSIGYLSPTYGWSPVASNAVYRFNSKWGVNGDYVWDPATKATNNADLNLHFSPVNKAVISAGYSYLINADATRARNNEGNDNALHQALLAYSWPLSDKWSTLGAYSQNISKNYSMMSLLGVQYDSCCWAMRVLGGRTFKSLNAAFEPQYNNNIYLQILLKGLGSVATSDPHAILSTYIPGYADPFHR